VTDIRNDLRGLCRTAWDVVVEDCRNVVEVLRPLVEPFLANPVAKVVVGGCAVLGALYVLPAIAVAAAHVVFSTIVAAVGIAAAVAFARVFLAL
jgi:hypothetical protein